MVVWFHDLGITGIALAFQTSISHSQAYGTADLSIFRMIVDSINQENLDLQHEIDMVQRRFRIFVRTKA